MVHGIDPALELLVGNLPADPLSDGADIGSSKPEEGLYGRATEEKDLFGFQLSPTTHHPGSTSRDLLISRSSVVGWSTSNAVVLPAVLVQVYPKLL